MKFVIIVIMDTSRIKMENAGNALQIAENAKMNLFVKLVKMAIISHRATQPV